MNLWKRLVRRNPGPAWSKDATGWTHGYYKLVWYGDSWLLTASAIPAPYPGVLIPARYTDEQLGSAMACLPMALKQYGELVYGVGVALL